MVSGGLLKLSNIVIKARRLEIANFIKAFNWKTIGFWSGPEIEKHSPGRKGIGYIRKLKGN